MVGIFSLGDQAMTYHRGKGSDGMEGNEGNDVLCGLSGNDAMNGNEGADNISVGDGNDRIKTGKGKDVVRSGQGKDVVRSGQGKDRMKTTTLARSEGILFGLLQIFVPGSSTIIAGEGNDKKEVVVMEDGDDRVDTEYTRDLRVVTGDGDDKLLRLRLSAAYLGNRIDEAAFMDIPNAYSLDSKIGRLFLGNGDDYAKVRKTLKACGYGEMFSGAGDDNLKPIPTGTSTVSLA
ncbi:hypothetical protein NDN08_005577 [Rhodosorus marinus]|uniref:Uncharacterized protein n=1 Tax=Rhodosorus marinus TaxID=101924 RepID=A0AAV8V4K0_9RHOD|nr:hypothetical protein NDN08_005577 [Rhodosorus marinus]